MTRRKLWGTVAAAIVALAVTVPAAMASTPLAVGASWTYVSWFGGDGAAIVNGPITFSHDGAAVITLTDAFCPGDVFRVSDGGKTLGSTSPSTSGGSCLPGIADPDAAMADGAYSSGRFAVGAGSHSLDVVATSSPWGSGGAWVRVDPLTKDMCKVDGWRAIQPFKSQGDCVSLVATGGRH